MRWKRLHLEKLFLFCLASAFLIFSFKSASAVNFTVNSSTEWQAGTFTNTTESNGVLELITYAYDVSTASYTDNLNVSAQDSGPLGMSWNSDGTKVYMIGNGNDNIYEYSCSAYDVSTCSYVDSLDVSAQASGPQGVSWNSDGTKMYMVGYNDNIYEYSCSAYDVSTCSYVDSLDVSAQDSYFTGMSWNSDGTKMYMAGYNNDNIYEYSCSAYDVSTCSYTDNLNVSAQDGTPRGMSWNSDGTKMYMAGDGNANIYEYSCSAYDVSTCSYTDNLDVSAQDDAPMGMSWNSDGTKVYMIGNGNDNIYEYPLTSYDTGSYTSKTFSASEEKAWQNVTAGGVTNGYLTNLTVQARDSTDTIVDTYKITNVLNGTNTYSLSISTSYNVSFKWDFIKGSTPEVDNTTIQGETAMGLEFNLYEPSDGKDMANQTKFKFMVNDILGTSGDLEVNLTLNGNKEWEDLSYTPGTNVSLQRELDIGSYSWNITAKDPDGNVGTSNTRSFNVSAYKLISEEYSTEDYETNSSLFQVKYDTYKEKVNLTASNSNFYYNGSSTSTSSFTDSDTLILNLTYTSPLLPTNSSKNYPFNFKSNIKLQNGTILNENTTERDQKVKPGYWIKSVSVPRSKYVEGALIPITTEFETILQNAEIQANTTLLSNQNQASAQDYNTYLYEENLPNQDTNTITRHFNSTLILNFQGNSRILDSSDQTFDSYKIGIDDCSTYSTKAYDFTLYNETDKESITGNMEWFYGTVSNGNLNESFNFSETNQSSFSVCMYPGWANYSIPDIWLSFDSDGYKGGEWRLYEANMDNSTNTIPVYLLNSGKADKLKIKLETVNGDPIKGAYVNFRRWYGTGELINTIGITRTSSKGVAYTYVNFGEYYSFLIDYQGETIKDTSSEIIDSSPRRFSIDLGKAVFFKQLKGLEYRKYWNEPWLVFEIQDETNELTRTVVRIWRSGIQREYICDKEVKSGSSAKITCNMSGEKEGYLNYNVFAELNSDLISIDSGVLDYTGGLSIMGTTGAVISALIILVVGMASGNPVPTVILTIGAVGTFVMMGFIGWSITLLWWLIVAGAFIVYLIRG